jgi:hypothetical protein
VAVRGIPLTLVAVATLGFSPGGASAAPLRATLKGVCTVATTLDHNGVVTSSTLTCTAKGSCACPGPTRLLYQTATVSPGNGAPGREQGTLSASGALGSVTLALTGMRSGVGRSAGVWSLAKSSGFRGVALTRRGSYVSQTTDLNAILGTRSTSVTIAASLACWDCGPAG